MISGLVRRELRGRYKGSVLGFLWTFINPLLQLTVYTIVFSVIMRAGIENYYLFLFVALIPWIFFSSSVAGGCSCILNHKDMVTKIYFPREVLPIAHVTTGMINMLYSFVVVFAVVLFSGVTISFQALMYLPIIVIVEYILCLGLSLIVSAFTVFFRDLEHFFGNSHYGVAIFDPRYVFCGSGSRRNSTDFPFQSHDRDNCGVPRYFILRTDSENRDTAYSCCMGCYFCGSRIYDF